MPVHQYAEIAYRCTQQAHVRVLLKPFHVRDVDKALRWLAGDTEEPDWQAHTQPTLR